MKRLFFVCYLLACILVTANTAYADKITLAADIWCPYNCEPKATNPGYMLEIAKIVFEKYGHTIEYRIVDWSAAIQLGRKDKINGIIGAMISDAPDFIYPENELGITTNVFYIKKGNMWRYKGTDSLKNVRVGIIKDYSYSDELDAYFKTNAKNTNNIQVVSGNDALVNNIKKLLSDRIDTFIEDKNVFLLTAKRLGATDKIEEAGVEDESGDKIYIGFSPKNPKSKEYAQILSNGVAELRKSGELKKILSKYGLSDWK